MSSDDALEIVCDCLLGEQSIPAQLRLRQGLNENRFAQLVAALRLLSTYYAAAEAVPKQLALCMVDIYGAFSFREGMYSEAVTARLEDAGIQLQGLAEELFGAAN